jgi:hypothetical protein
MLLGAVVASTAGAADNGPSATIATQMSAVEQRAVTAQLVKLKAAPRPATDEAYQQAAKKAGVDFSVMHTEHQALVAEKDKAAREKKIQVLSEKYTPLFLKVSKDAGVDVVAERKKAVLAYTPAMATPAPKTVELTQTTAAPKTAELTFAAPRATPVVRELPLTGFVMTEPASPPATPPPPSPASTTINLGLPFDERATSNANAIASSSNGYLEVGNGSHFFGAGIESASLGKKFVVRAGLRRIDVVADLADVHWQLFGNAFGHMMGMLRVVLFLNDGAQVLCNDAHTLSEFSASGVVWVDERQTRPQMRVACSFTRPPGAPEQTLSASVRLSATSVSSGTPADMFSEIYGRLSALHVTTSP